MTSAIRSWLGRHWLPWLPAVLGPALVFVPALLRGQALFWGTPLLQFIPWRVYAKLLVAEGQLPLWNPLLGMGAPLLANYQSALLYPPNWLLLLLDVAWGQTLLAALHLTFAALGMAVLAKRLGLSRFAQTVAAVTYGLSGYLVTRAGFLSINATAAWLPWIVWAGDRLVLGHTIGPSGRAISVSGKRSTIDNATHPRADHNTPLRDVGLLAITLALQWLAGHAQLAWYSLLFAGAWMAVRRLVRYGWSGLRPPATRLALAGVLALTIAAAQLLPTAEYLSVSDRSGGLDTEFVMTYSFWPWRLIGLVAPDMFGHPRDGSYWGYGNFWEDAIYIGVLPLLLAASAVLRRSGPPMRWFLVAVGTIALLLALGRNTPLFPWLFQHVPSFGLFQAPTRWNLLLVFVLAMLAGFGAQQWGAAKGRKLYWLRLGTAGAAGIVATALAGGAVLSGQQLTFIPAVALAGGLMLASGALALVRADRPSSSWQAAAIGLVLADLLFAARGANPTLSAVSLRPGAAGPVDAAAGQRLYMPPDVERHLKFDLAFRFDDFRAAQDWSFVRESALPNTSVLDGLESANNFDPILPARYVSWMAALDVADQADRASLYRHMAVAWLADPNGNYRPLSGAQYVRLVPSALWVPDARSAIERIAAGDIDLDQQVVLEGEPRPGRHSATGAAEIRMERPTASRVDLHVESRGGGWLVLADTWYPGWNVYLDEQPTESYPANGTFRASWVPAGTHQVTYRYEPASFRLGVALTGLGFVVLAWVLRR